MPISKGFPQATCLFLITSIVLIDEDAGHMWWDLLLGRGYSAERDSKGKDAMFQAMTKILEIPSLVCQVCALHGLGHLEHVGKKAVIENYLLGNLDLEDNVREYALVAIEGKVL